MEVDGSTELLLKGAEGVFRGLPQKKFEISGFEKCILVDPGDVFAMDNGESKKPSDLIGGCSPPDPPPGFATDLHVKHLYPFKPFNVCYDYIWHDVVKRTALNEHMKKKDVTIE